MSNDYMTIAKTIQQQIGWNSFACMGVKASTVTAIRPTIDTDPMGHLGGLSFKFSNCPKVRSGTVNVTLDGTDTYTVRVFNVRGREIAKMEGVYCDMLGGRDGVIEGVTG